MKSPTQKKRLCIALPGINYTPHSPYVLSTLPMVPYLEKDYEITVVYRKIVDPQGLDYPVLTILDPEQMSEKERDNQSGYYSPNNYLELWRSQQEFKRFAHQYADRFDLILEKEWPLLGLFSEVFHPYKIPTLLLAEAVYKFEVKTAAYSQGNPVKALLRQALRPGFDQVRPNLRKQWSRKVSGIVAETRQLKEFLLEEGYATEKTPIYPIPYGVNLEYFQPLDRALCRQKLGLDPEKRIIVYVGSLNRFIQEPAPLIEALGREQIPNLEFHLVGDGGKRQELEEIARQFNAPVVFHGRVTQSEVPYYIGAANLCSAPYDKSLYPGEKFTCASLKIPEYLACDRPVLTIPCGRMEDLLHYQQYGFLVENQVEAYRAFLRTFPKIETFQNLEANIHRDRTNGFLKAQRLLLTWEDIADLHQQAIEEQIQGSAPTATTQG